MIDFDKTLDGAAAAYEELRSHVLSGSPGGPSFGTIVLLREGIAAWIERGAARGVATVRTATSSRTRPVLSEALLAEIVHVLADIALQRREEIKP